MLRLAAYGKNVSRCLVNMVLKDFLADEPEHCGRVVLRV